MSHVMTLERARALALASQGLTGAPFPAGRPGVHAALDRLGYVQIDTIAIVERAHHHVIWSRVPDYRPPVLDALYGAGIFEYWSHAAALMPIQDFRHCLPRMRAFAEGHRHWFRRNRRTMRHVLDRIRAEGPLSASDFEAPPGHRGGSWFEWKPAKKALEHLFHEGALMVARRRAFQKVFDLTERVLPPGTDTSMPTLTEHGEWLVRRALRAHGVASEREIDYLRPRERGAVRAGLAALERSGEIRRLRLEGETVFALESALRSPPGLEEDGRARLLSPFDNLVIQRRRLERLFGFRYQLECYVPERKRVHGYFCLPILWNGRLVGRLDPRADRAGRMLHVRRMSFEKGFAYRGALRRALDEELERFAAFNGCDGFRLEAR